MTKKYFPIIALAIIVFAGLSTAAVYYLYPYQPDKPPKTDDSNATPEVISDVVKANNTFAFDLYAQLTKDNNTNLFYSPYSISSALAMTYEGAKGQTAEEIKTTFHFPEFNELRPNFAAIYNGINAGSSDYELRTGNALWVQQDFPLLKDYTNIIEKYYGGKVANLDFIKESEGSRKTINTFIEEQTNDKIKDLIPTGFIDKMTRLILTNAIYFKGTWQWEFDDQYTQEMDFRISPTNIVQTPIMNMSPDKATLNYADTNDLQILELPYKGDKLSMLILLPSGELNEIESSLNASKLQELKSAMKPTKLDSISLPKFKFDTKYTLSNYLIELGMPTAFSEAADFSGMTVGADLYINGVIHQAYVSVDEKGTEAAAATAVGMKTTSISEQIEFHANRPFIFIIQEKMNDNIIFLGRVIDPSN